MCNEVFQAVDSLAHELPAPRPDAFAEDADSAPAAAEPMPEPPRGAGEGAARTAVDWMERVLGLEGEAGDAPGRRGRQWLQGVAAVLLVLLALAQYGHFNSGSLAAEATWRPYVAALCAVTGCPVPPDRKSVV